jgi:iron complex transport system substrate-binding protein
VESVNPTTLAEVFAMFRRVGALLDRQEGAGELVARFESTANEVARRRGADGPARPDSPRSGLLLLEWLDPPFGSGHWNPEIIHLAGGVDPAACAGQRSRRLSWSDVAACRADMILAAPCGFGLDRALAELEALRHRPEWRNLTAVKSGRVAVADGSAYFSRPGPRLEISLRIAAAIIAPESCGDLAPPQGEGWCTWPE